MWTSWLFLAFSIYIHHLMSVSFYCSSSPFPIFPSSSTNHNLQSATEMYLTDGGGKGGWLCWRGLLLTWCGFLQRVPAVEGPLLLLTQIGAVLQQPMRDPALADTWNAARHRVTTERFAPSTGAICRQPCPGRIEETGVWRRTGWVVETNTRGTDGVRLPSLSEILSR